MRRKLHHRAKLPTSAVRQMRAEYVPGKIGYETLAKKFGCGISTARDIVNHYTRPDFDEARGLGSNILREGQRGES